MTFVFKIDEQGQIASIKVIPIPTYTSASILIYHNLFKPSSVIALLSCLQIICNYFQGSDEYDKLLIIPEFFPE